MDGTVYFVVMVMVPVRLRKRITWKRHTICRWTARFNLIQPICTWLR